MTRIRKEHTRAFAEVITYFVIIFRCQAFKAYSLVTKSILFPNRCVNNNIVNKMLCLLEINKELELTFTTLKKKAPEGIDLK